MHNHFQKMIIDKCPNFNDDRTKIPEILGRRDLKDYLIIVFWPWLIWSEFCSQMCIITTFLCEKFGLWLLSWYHWYLIVAERSVSQSKACIPPVDQSQASNAVSWCMAGLWSGAITMEMDQIEFVRHQASEASEGSKALHAPPGLHLFHSMPVNKTNWFTFNWVYIGLSPLWVCCK